MIIYNKLILSTWQFNYPFFLILVHTLMATALTQLFARTTSLLPGVKENKIKRRDYVFKLLPYAFCSFMSLVLSNKVYQYLSLGYIQMLKAITPVPLLMLFFLSGKEKLSLMQFIIVVVICSGVMMTSIGELHFSAVGFSLQIVAVVFDCLRVFLLDVVLKDISLDSLSMLYYSAPLLSFQLTIGFILFEYDAFPFDRLNSSFAFVLFFSGLLAFSLNLSVFILVSNTSSLIMTLAGPIKDLLVISTSVLFFRSPLTLLQVLGFLVALGGLSLYREFKANPERLHGLFVRLVDLCLRRLTGSRVSMFSVQSPSSPPLPPTLGRSSPSSSPGSSSAASAPPLLHSKELDMEMMVEETKVLLVGEERK